jgi:hypothetical protein
LPADAAPTKSGNGFLVSAVTTAGIGEEFVMEFPEHAAKREMVEIITRAKKPAVKHGRLTWHKLFFIAGL